MATKSGSSGDSKGVNPNPSGASDEQIKKGEMAGKVRGPDVDTSFHVYEFTDPNTGEPVETQQVVHDVMAKSDGTTEKGDASFVHGDGGASGGEAGEHSKGTSK
jgi:hypothetical protein